MGSTLQDAKTEEQVEAMDLQTGVPATLEHLLLSSPSKAKAPQIWEIQVSYRSVSKMATSTQERTQLEEVALKLKITMDMLKSQSNRSLRLFAMVQIH